MNNFFDSELCKRGDACMKCRRSSQYRKGIVAAFDTPTEVEFDCPKGKTKEDYPLEVEPNIFQMGAGLVKTLGREAKARMNPRRKTVSPEKQAERMSICAGCEFLKNGNRCIKCGCMMKFKTRLLEGECPIGKWGRIIDEKESE